MLLNSQARSVTDGIIYFDWLYLWVTTLLSKAVYWWEASNMTYMQMVLQANMGVLPPTWLRELRRFGTDKCEKMTMPKKLHLNWFKDWQQGILNETTLKCDILIVDQVWILILVVGPPNILVSNSSLVIFSNPLNSAPLALILKVKRRLMDQNTQFS